MRGKIVRIVELGAVAAALAFGSACSRPGHADHRGATDALALPVATVPGAVLASVEGKPITTGDVDVQLGNRLLRVRVEEYAQKRQVLQGMIATALLENEAARRHASLNELLDQEVEKKARPVTDEEAAAVYEALPDRFRTTARPDALRSIAESMRRQRVAQRRQNFTKELERAAHVQVFLEPPRVRIQASGQPTRGPADAPVEIVEFSDFQCPYCAQMARMLHELAAQYPGKIRLVFRDFPLPMHKDAATAAEAAACAGDQGKYWEMHDRLFAGQKNLARSDLTRYAADIRLQPAKFAACLDGGGHTADWQKDRTDGEKYGVTGTPALFINGRPVFGAATIQDLVQVVGEELERAQLAENNHVR